MQNTHHAAFKFKTDFQIAFISCYHIIIFRKPTVKKIKCNQLCSTTQMLRIAFICLNMRLSCSSIFYVNNFTWAVFYWRFFSKARAWFDGWNLKDNSLSFKLKRQIDVWHNCCFNFEYSVMFSYKLSAYIEACAVHHFTSWGA